MEKIFAATIPRRSSWPLPPRYWPPTTLLLNPLDCFYCTCRHCIALSYSQNGADALLYKPSVCTTLPYTSRSKISFSIKKSFCSAWRLVLCSIPLGSLLPHPDMLRRTALKGTGSLEYAALGESVTTKSWVSWRGGGVFGTSSIGRFGTLGGSLTLASPRLAGRAGRARADNSGSWLGTLRDYGS